VGVQGARGKNGQIESFNTSRPGKGTERSSNQTTFILAEREGKKNFLLGKGRLEDEYRSVKDPWET